MEMENGNGRIESGGGGGAQFSGCRVQGAPSLLWVAATDCLQTLIYVVSAVRSELVAGEFIWCVVGCLVYWLKN